MKLPDELVANAKARWDAAKPAEREQWTKLEGFQEDEKIPVRVRYWEGIRRTLAHMMEAAVQVVRECDEMLARVKHADGCPGAGNETEQCDWKCPDREWRLSALAIRATFERFVGLYKLPTANSDGIVLPPAREFLDQMIAELDLLRQRDDWRNDVYENHPIQRPDGAPELERLDQVDEEQPKGEPQ